MIPVRTIPTTRTRSREFWKIELRSPSLPAFTVATELDQRLLMERLIIEVPGTPVRYIPHPTIVPLIPGLGAS